MTFRIVSSRLSDESPESAACPICRTPDAVACPPGRDRLFDLAHGLFNLFRCLSCGCVFQHPLPEDSALSEFYPREYWWSEEPAQESRSARLFRKLEKTYREFVVADHVRFLDFCARENLAGGKLLLDIGCGSGTFLHVAQSHGFVPHGMDRSPQAAEIVRRQYGCPVRQGEIGSKVWDDYRFDFITMFHVLEHLPDPRLGLRYAGELLQPGGTLIIQVPNVSSIQARLFGNRWYGLDVPRHVINFTPKALAFLLRETGFEFRLCPGSHCVTIPRRLHPVWLRGWIRFDERAGDRTQVRFSAVQWKLPISDCFPLRCPPPLWKARAASEELSGLTRDAKEINRGFTRIFADNLPFSWEQI